ncbi:MAG: hypothetical protein J6C11_01445 [Spirochaetaceae bacterium]|nr:hypothetical protein [Spirochaetaceae bacterium]
MADLSRYIEDGKMNRVRIANDIAAGKFTQEFLSELLQKLQKPELKANYFSHVKLERKPESEWTKEYLNLLSNAVVAENFNEEYLRYLFEVAQYVHQRGQNNPQKKTFLLVGAVVALLVCLGLLAVCVRQCGAEKDGGGDYVQETR